MLVSRTMPAGLFISVFKAKKPKFLAEFTTEKKKTRNLEGWAIKKTKTELTFSINFLINKKRKQNKKTKN